MSADLILGSTGSTPKGRGRERGCHGAENIPGIPHGFAAFLFRKPEVLCRFKLEGGESVLV